MHKKSPDACQGSCFIVIPVTQGFDGAGDTGTTGVAMGVEVPGDDGAGVVPGEAGVIPEGV